MRTADPPSHTITSPDGVPILILMTWSERVCWSHPPGLRRCRHTLEVPERHIAKFREAIAALDAKAVDDGAESMGFLHVKTLKSAHRYKCSELVHLDRTLADAAFKAAAREAAIFRHLLSLVQDAAPYILAIARAVAVVDVTAALAELADDHGYTRPVVDAGTHMHADAARHVVVERALNEGWSRMGGAGAGSQSAPAVAPLGWQRTFVCNDLRLGGVHGEGEGTEAGLWLITGPNMGGKSTFLRQSAQLAVLAQMGSFVPADRAHIGVVDKIFSRVGAADDLSRDRSTFMVEMEELATILKRATKRSLVVIDEVGRGTSTEDGIAIALAVRGR